MPTKEIFTKCKNILCLWGVLNGYNKIQKMTGHGRFFNTNKEEEGENSSNEGSDDEEEETNESGSADASSSSDGSSKSESGEM